MSQFLRCLQLSFVCQPKLCLILELFDLSEEENLSNTFSPPLALAKQLVDNYIEIHLFARVIKVDQKSNYLILLFKSAFGMEFGPLKVPKP